MARRSQELFDGDKGAYARALTKATGRNGGDLAKPQIAIANSWNEAVPGHIHLRGLAEAVKRGIRRAGCVPVEFNTIAVCDGIAGI